MVLTECRGAVPAHFQKPLSPIPPHPGQDHADRAGSEPRGGSKQDINRGAVPRCQRALREPAGEAMAAAADLEMHHAARGDIDMAQLQRRAVTRLADPWRAILVEPLGEARGEALRHMLGDDRGGAVGGEGREHREQGIDASGRGPIAMTRPLARKSGAAGLWRLPAPRVSRGARAAAFTLAGRSAKGSEGPPMGGFGNAVESADSQCLDGSGRPLADLGGHHDDGSRSQPHDLLEKCEPIHARHVDVERDDIGRKGLDRLARLVGVTCLTDHGDLWIPLEMCPEDGPHGRGIVDNEHPGRVHFCPRNRFSRSVRKPKPCPALVPFRP